MSLSIDPIKVGTIDILILQHNRIEKLTIDRCALDVVGYEVIERCDLEPPTFAVPVAGKGNLVRNLRVEIEIAEVEAPIRGAGSKREWGKDVAFENAR